MNQVTRAVRGGQLDFDATDTGTADAVLCQVGLASHADRGRPALHLHQGANRQHGDAFPTLTITDLQGNNGLTGTIVKATAARSRRATCRRERSSPCGPVRPGVFALVSLLAPSDVIAPTPGASSTKVSKAPGIEANQVGGAGTYIPASTAVAEAFGNVVKSNLVTSTWTGTNRLTVGANEAGIWAIQAAVHLPAISSSYYCQISIWKNGVQVTSGTTTQATANTGQYLQVGGLIDLAAGDVVQIYVYQQSSSAITSSADNTTNFSAFLIASY